MNAYAALHQTAHAPAGRVLLGPVVAGLILVLTAGESAAQVRDTTAAARLAAADSIEAVRLAPLVVTAARVPVRADRVGISMSVLSGDDLRRGHARNAADALRNLDGAFIDEANGPGGPTIIRLRGGEEVFTQIMMDGVRINQNGGFFDLQGFAPGNLDRIEVARGPQSALYGSSAMSGVVHFVTRSGEPGRPLVGVNLEGSDAAAKGGGYRGNVDVNGGTDVVRYSVGAGWTFDRGIHELPNDTKSSDASLRLDVAATDRVAFAGTFRFIGVEAKLPIRDPGATRVPQDPNALNERDRLISSVAARFAPSSRWVHELRGTLYRENFVYADQRDDVNAGGTFPFFIFDADFRLDSRLVRSAVEYSGSWTQPGRSLTVSWGALRENERLHDVTSGEFGDGDQELERSSTAAFAEILASPHESVDLIAGARIEKYEGLDAAFTPRASAVIRLAPDVLSVRMAAGRAYKAPNLQEQYLENPFIVSNPDLAPEKSTSFEAGVDASTRDGVLSGGLTAFRQTFTDLIRSVPIDDDGRAQNRNLGESRATGIEWRVAVRPNRRWAAGLDGAHVATRIIDATGLSGDAFPEDEELPFRPDVIASAWLELTPATGLTARLRGSHVGAQTVLTERFGGERVRIDGYTLAGITVDYRLSAALTLHGRFDNLFDASYLTAFDRRGIPATAAIGLRWQN